MIERTTRWLDEWRLLIAVLFVIGAVAAGEMVYGALRPRSGPHSWYLLRVDGATVRFLVLSFNPVRTRRRKAVPPIFAIT